MDPQQQFLQNLNAMIQQMQSTASATNSASQAMSGASGAAQQVQHWLTQSSQAISNNTQATQRYAQAMQLVTARQQYVSETWSSLGGVTNNLASGLTRITGSIYNTDKAFTAVIPTLELVIDTVVGVSKSIGAGLSGINFLGTSLGNMPQVLSNLLIKPLELSKPILVFALEASQKLADTFVEISKVGGLYGGGLAELHRYTTAINIPLQSFQKIISQNVEDISSLGVGMRQGAQIVAGLGRDIFVTNDAVAALYGNIEEVSRGTAEYLALQAQLGVNILSYTDKMGRLVPSTTEYLIRQRELSAITGKTVENMKKEEEARRMQLDYNLKAGRLGDDARNNLVEAMQLTGKVFGAEALKYAEEYFATGGNVYTEQALKFQALQPVVASSVDSLVNGIDRTRDEFRTNYQSMFQSNAGALENYARSNEQYASINRAANNDALRMMSETSVGILNNLTLLQSGFAGFNFKEFRDKLSQVKLWKT